jgi:diguanylate cyclase (GGDEF)-like protein
MAIQSQRLPTIRSKLALLVLACVTPASLLAVVLISHDYREGRARLMRDSQSAARAMMSAVDRELAGTQAAALALATSPYLKTGDLAAFYAQARDVLRTGRASNFVLVDESSRQRVNTLRPFGGSLPGESNPVLRRVFATGQPMTTDLFAGSVTGRKVIAVAVPIYRGEKVAYVLAAGIWPETLSEMLTQQQLPTGWIGTIFDRTGTIVARTRDAEKFVGQKGAPALVERMAQAAEDALEDLAAGGVPVVSVFSRSARSSWTAAIDIPAESLTSELWRSLWWVIAATAALVCGSLALAWSIGGRIAESVHDLTKPAMALALGERVEVPRLALKETDEVGRALTDASKALREAEHKANHDPLTGLANRTLFDEILRRQIALCGRAGMSLSIVYLDLDGFKAINDAYGHAAGDQVLRIAAGRLQSRLRDSDLAARLGGDEFAVVLADTGLSTGAAVAEELTQTLSAPYSLGPTEIVISASAGVAAYPDCGVSVDALLHHADQAMYAAKAAAKQRPDAASA